MTEEKIIEGNTLIAEFMGYTVYRKRYPRNHGIGAPEAEWKDIIIEKAKFHKSWDAIMPVITQIYKTNPSALDPKGTKNAYDISTYMKHFRIAKEKILNIPVSKNITFIWNEVVEFISRYNNMMRDIAEMSRTKRKKTSPFNYVLDKEKNILHCPTLPPKYEVSDDYFKK